MNIDIQYDAPRDVFTIEGVEYSGQMFRLLGVAEPGTWIRIEERSLDGHLILSTVSDQIGKCFDVLAGRMCAPVK